jgi:hypothetical protein
MALAERYFRTQVAGQAEGTVDGKQRDLECFPTFYVKMWTAMEETGMGALGALAVGAGAVPVGEEMGALPRTPSRPYGRSCLQHDRSSSDLPVAPLWRDRLCP